MRYDLIASDDEILHPSSSGIKRTKSFWKFGGRNDDILAGMSLWQHRDLVVAPNLDEIRGDPSTRGSNSSQLDGVGSQDRERHKDYDKNVTLTKSTSNNSSSLTTEKMMKLQPPARKDSITSMEMFDDDENIYGMSSTLIRNGSRLQQQQHHSSQPTYTPKSRMKIMKTIEIDIENPTESERMSTIKHEQKQYNNSGGIMLQTAAAAPTASLRNISNMKSNNATSSVGNGLKKKTSANVDNKISRNTAKMPIQDMLQSTEDEADNSEDNGTLKISDINHFFDDLSQNDAGNLTHNGGSGNDTNLIMKTVKRKDILKQYYTSEDESDDVEVKSTSSDPYDCIVINDHLVRKDEKLRRQHLHNSYHQEQHQMEFQTFRSSNNVGNVGSGNTTAMHKDVRNGGHSKQSSLPKQEHYSTSTLTRQKNGKVASAPAAVAATSVMSTPTATILPRTRLMKSSNHSHSLTLERSNTEHNKYRHNEQDNRAGNTASISSEQQLKEKHCGKTYGPWYDFWDQDSAQHTLNSQKSMSHNKLK